MIFVGAYQAFSGQGVVQIFRQTGTDEKAPWAYVNNLVPFTTPATPATANFGWDVDLDEKSNENTVIVGAPGNGGGVFIYKEDEQNTWKPFGVKVFSPDGDDNEFNPESCVMLPTDRDDDDDDNDGEDDDDDDGDLLWYYARTVPPSHSQRTYNLQVMRGRESARNKKTYSLRTTKRRGAV